MSAALNKNLLDSEREAPPRSYRRTVVVSAAVAALLLSASFVGYAVGKNSATVNRGVFGNNTELGAMYQFTDTCYSPTGIKCPLTASRCDGRDERCEQGMCHCAGISNCAGADGSCYGEQNQKINSKPFKLTNVKWYNYDMYVPYFGVYNMMRLARWCVTCESFEFNLYKLPGGKFRGHELYFIGFENYGSTWTLSIHRDAIKSTWGLYAMDLGVGRKDPAELGVRVCSMRNLVGYDAIKIGRTLENGHNVWARAHAASVFVYGWDTRANGQEPGDQGYWTLKDMKTNEALEGAGHIYEGLEDCEA